MNKIKEREEIYTTNFAADLKKKEDTEKIM